jgi:hypothetical protein
MKMSTSTVKKIVTGAVAALAIAVTTISAGGSASADDHLRSVSGTIAGTVTATDVSNFPVSFSARFDFIATLDGLGSFVGTGPADFLPSFDPVTGCRDAGAVDFTWTAENGDTLTTVALIDADNPFQSCVIPAPAGPPSLHTTGSFLVAGGTGAFKNIGENVIKFDLTNPAGPVVPFSGTLEGEIDSTIPYHVIEVSGPNHLSSVTVEKVSDGVKYANVINGTDGNKIILVTVNGEVEGVKWVTSGATVSLKISKNMEKGENNTVVVTIVGAPGSTTQVILAPKKMD